MDLFGEISVTDSDIELWLDSILATYINRSNAASMKLPDHQAS